MDKEYVFVRGINCEVSMPTGSLCAERNCISQALSRNLALRRTDLAAIAILSLKGYLRLPGASHYDQFIRLRREADRKAARAAAAEKEQREREQRERQTGARPFARRQRKPVEIRVDSGASVASSGLSNSGGGGSREGAFQTYNGASSPPTTRVRSPRLRGTGHQEGYGSLSFSRNASSPLAKRRRIEDMRGAAVESAPESVSSVLSSSASSADGSKVGAGQGKEPPPLRLPANNNPIAPCGVCNEWLRKISEVSEASTATINH